MDTGESKVGQSPHGRDDHAPFFAVQSPISKSQWYDLLYAKSME